MLPILRKKPDFRKFSLLIIFSFSLTMLLSFSNRGKDLGNVLASTFVMPKCADTELQKEGQYYAVENGKPCYFDFKVTLTKETIFTEIINLNTEAKKDSKPLPFPNFTKPGARIAVFYNFADPSTDECAGLVINGAPGGGNKRHGNPATGYANYIIYDQVKSYDKNGKQLDSAAYLLQYNGPQLESPDGQRTCKGILKFKVGTSAQIPLKLRYNNKGYVAPTPTPTATRPKSGLTPTRPTGTLTPTQPRVSITPTRPTGTLTPTQPRVSITPTSPSLTISQTKPAPTPVPTLVISQTQPEEESATSAAPFFICESEQYSLLAELAKFFGREVPPCDDSASNEPQATDPDYTDNSSYGDTSRGEESRGEESSSNSSQGSSGSTENQSGYNYDQTSQGTGDTSGAGYGPEASNGAFPGSENFENTNGQTAEEPQQDTNSECIQPNIVISTFNSLRGAITGQGYDPCAPVEQSTTTKTNSTNLTPLGSQVDCNSVVERVRRLFGQVSPACENN